MVIRNLFYKLSVSSQALKQSPKPKWIIHHLRKKDGSVKPLIFIQHVR